MSPPPRKAAHISLLRRRAVLQYIGITIHKIRVFPSKSSKMLSIYETQWLMETVLAEDHEAFGAPYVSAKIVSVRFRGKDSLSLNCLNSSVSSLRMAVMMRISALSCSIRAFCLSEFCFAFW